MVSRLERYAREQREAAREALDDLLSALAPTGVVLASAGLDGCSPFTGRVLVELGRARPDMVHRLAAVVRTGVQALAPLEGAALPASTMTLRTYRITPTGHRTELAHCEVTEGEPYQRPITAAWPACACPRC